jgi:hypothetical protein
MDEWFFSALKVTTRAIEVGGIAIIVLGILGASIAVQPLSLESGPRHPARARVSRRGRHHQHGGH